MTHLTLPRDHGGNLDAAQARFGGALGDWIDLSTGINPCPYPIPEIPADAWAALPRRREMDRLIEAARAAYGTQLAIAPLAGAQGAIQIVPYLRAAGQARVLAPTYNEHAGALRGAGWQVTECPTLDALAGADLAVVVNPNNPDGKHYAPAALRALSDKVGLLVVDESFADPTPDLSLCGTLDLPSNILILRSFGKFYGLAGLRLGFAIGTPELVTDIARMAGPWPVAGPAISIAEQALADRFWHGQTCLRLSDDCARLDRLATEAGWQLVGGTSLFRTYACPDAQATQDRLARAHLWTRIFPYSKQWIRLGLPGTEAQWERLTRALTRE